MELLEPVRSSSTSEFKSDPERDRPTGPNDTEPRGSLISPFLTPEESERVIGEFFAEEEQRQPGFTSIQYEINLSGTGYRAKKQGEGLVVEHPHWSIRAEGLSLVDAEKALIKKIQSAVEIYACNMNVDQSGEFEELHTYVLQHGVLKPRPSVESVISRALRAYEVRDPDVIARYIKQHPHIYFVLDAAPVHIGKHFPDAELRLELYQDPGGEMSDEVAIYIRTRLEPSEALDRLAELDESWWFESAAFSGDQVSLNLEYA